MDSPSHAHLPQSFEHFEMNNEGRAFMLTRDKGSQEDVLSMFHTPSKELQSSRSKYMDPNSSSVLARLLRRLPLRRSRDRVYVFRSLIVYNTDTCKEYLWLYSTYNNLAAPDPIAWALGTPSLSFQFMCAV